GALSGALVSGLTTPTTTIFPPVLGSKSSGGGNCLTGPQPMSTHPRQALGLRRLPGGETSFPGLSTRRRLPTPSNIWATLEKRCIVLMGVADHQRFNG